MGTVDNTTSQSGEPHLLRDSEQSCSDNFKKVGLVDAKRAERAIGGRIAACNEMSVDSSCTARSPLARRRIISLALNCLSLESGEDYSASNLRAEFHSAGLFFFWVALQDISPG